jgi:hypothetical protein
MTQPNFFEPVTKTANQDDSLPALMCGGLVEELVRSLHDFSVHTSAGSSKLTVATSWWR